ncbi:MAG: hypothetical protein KIH69_013100 [Anaerolineae bacterium]|nr:hypothetical protein [Anaerolineae bacterium]
MKNSPEKLAWFVLLTSFVIFCALVVGVPATVLSLINTATLPAYGHIRLQAGKVLTLEPNAVRASFVDLNGFAVEDGTLITVDDDGQQSVGLLTFAVGQDSGPFATLNLYAGTQVRVVSARTPRFWRSVRSPQVTLEMLTGRAEVQVYEANDFRLEINTPYGTMRLDEGLHSLQVDKLIVDPAKPEQADPSRGSAVLYVLRGSAQAQSQLKNSSPLVAIPAGQQAKLQIDQAAQILPQPSRNLVRNNRFVRSFFDDQLDWRYAATTALLDDKPGQLSVTRGEKGAVVSIERAGINASSTSLSQQIEASIENSRKVFLRTEFAIAYHSLEVCGSQGSECPLMIKIVFQEKNGNQREWIQGFYVRGVPNAQSPDYVRTNPQLRHLKKRPGEREVFESENLLAAVPNAQAIKSVSIVAEGHSLKLDVYGLDLIVVE